MIETLPRTLACLLDGLVDYAGLFPPAREDMETMVKGFDEGLDHPMGWMLARVIVPVGKLDEFEQAAASLLPDDDTDDPWCLSVLVSPAGSDELEGDIERLAAFNERHCNAANGLALADVIELRADSAEAIDSALDLLPDDLFPFFELSSSSDSRGLLAALAGSEAAAKIRTGGIKPELNPATADVARFIRNAVQADVPFKATAGLHHPLPNENPSIPAHQQGFLNVFLASAAAAVHRLNEGDIVELLDYTGAIEFEDDQVSIDGLVLGCEQLEASRGGTAISFGSCSWREPIADLQSLGYLPRLDSSD